MNKINGLPPFKRFCVTIGNLPSSYVDSMSYYECIMWLCKFLQENVIPTVNENAEAVNELINWFNNLDVQDEIDHKLDEMVESGQLQEIISEYLNSTAVFGFDTIDDMKSATNLIDGSYARTMGYYTINDGGSGLYKIRTITNDDVIDEGSIIELNSDDLIAELIDLDVHVKKFGCYGDNTHNDTVQFNRAISYAESTDKNLIIDTGSYLVDGLTINNTINMVGKGIESKIYLNPESDNNGAIIITNNGFTDSTFKNFNIICNYAVYASGIYSRPTIMKANNKLVIDNVNIYNSNKNGIDIYPDDQTKNIGTEITNLKIAGCKENGILLKGTDMVLSNIISFTNEQCGIKGSMYSTKINNVKCYQNGKGDYTTLESDDRTNPEATGTYYKKYAGMELELYHSTLEQIDMQENGGDGICITAGYNNEYSNLNLDNNGYLDNGIEKYTPISYSSVGLIPIYYGIYFKNHNMITISAICHNMHYSTIGAQQRNGIYLNHCQYVSGSLTGGNQYNNELYEYTSDCETLNLIINGTNKGMKQTLSSLTLPTGYSFGSGSYIERIGSTIRYFLVIKKTSTFTDGETISGITAKFRTNTNTFATSRLSSDNNGWSGYGTTYFQILANGSIVIKVPSGDVSNYAILDLVIINQ